LAPKNDVPGLITLRNTSGIVLYAKFNIDSLLDRKNIAQLFSDVLKQSQNDDQYGGSHAKPKVFLRLFHSLFRARAQNFINALL